VAQMQDYLDSLEALTGLVERSRHCNILFVEVGGVIIH
jgi:hypothetical protein